MNDLSRLPLYNPASEYNSESDASQSSPPKRQCVLPSGTFRCPPRPSVKKTLSQSRRELGFSDDKGDLSKKPLSKYLALTTTDEYTIEQEGLPSLKFKRSAQLFGQGDYSNVYRIAENQPPLSGKFSNQMIVFKQYKNDRINSNLQNLLKFLTNQMTQYKALQKIQFPVAEILNDPEKDLFFLFERITEEFKNTWGAKTIEVLKSSDDLEDKKSMDRLNQVRCMFHLARTDDIKVDLFMRNILIKNINGQEVLTLIDLREDDYDENFEVLAISHYKSFAKYKVEHEDPEAPPCFQINQTIIDFLSTPLVDDR
jgi:hypothetical protein